MRYFPNPAVFPYFSTFFQKGTCQKEFTDLRGPICNFKGYEILYLMQKRSSCYDKRMHLYITLNFYMCPKFAKIFGAFSENLGEIPHVGSKSVRSKGLRAQTEHFRIFSSFFNFFLLINSSLYSAFRESYNTSVIIVYTK